MRLHGKSALVTGGGFGEGINACLRLAEDASSFITGVLLPVDGGRIA
jgi:hypothetical protein